MTPKETAMLLATLRAFWSEVVINESTIKGWSWAFEDISYDAAEGAVKQWIRTNKWPPKPAELRELIAEAATDIEPWEAAWAEIVAARKRYGSYVGERWGNQGAQWSSDLIARALRHIGGYQAFCAATFDEEPILRAQFRDAYQRLRAAEVRRVQIGDAGIPADRQIEESTTIMALPVRRTGGAV